MAINEPFGAPNAEKLRELAAWYREFAERSGSSAIAESRLRIAEDELYLKTPQMNREFRYVRPK